MSMNLYQANKQWSVRPADERFWTLEEMYSACKQYADTAKEMALSCVDIRVEAVDEDVRLVGRKGQPALLTHWSFGQLSGLVGAPADYLRGLSATLAVQNLNWGLKHRADRLSEDASNLKLLFHQNGDLLLRAITSEKYTRIWNYEVAQRLVGLQDLGWRVPPARPAQSGQPKSRPATEQDVLRLKMANIGIQVGDTIAPAGIYASDHDMFVFLVNEDNRINDGTPEGLGRGFFVTNSEVGGGSFVITTFLYRFVCGNHIVYDAQQVAEIRIRHTGAADQLAWSRLQVQVKRYANSSVSELEAKIARARQYEIAGSKEEVLDKIFAIRNLGCPRKTLDLAYETAVQYEDTDGSPRTPWGMAQGLTRVSQATDYADVRMRIDRAAGKVLEVF